MGLRGPAPKPSNLRRMEGNPGRRPFNEQEPKYRTGVPRKPKSLSPAARKIWDDLVDEMAIANTLRTVDGAALAELCGDIATLAEAEVGLVKLKRQIAAKAKDKGQDLPGESPLLSLMQSTAGRRMQSSIAELKRGILLQRREFGLTLASVSRVESAGGRTLDDEVNAAMFA